MKITHRSGGQGGFTLMEMILVLGIIAMLLGVGVYFMIDVGGDADEGAAKADITAINTSLIRYKTLARLYPTTEQGLNALVRKPVEGPQPARWKPLLKEQALVDPWGEIYQYIYPGKNNPETFDIFSKGKDRQAGTEDDIGNWE